jgi:hypothetical protein
MPFFPRPFFLLSDLPEKDEMLAQKMQMAERADRRATERFSVNADASCPFLSPVVEDFGPVKIKDVSMQDIGLVTSRRVEPGALLAIVLANAARGFTKIVLVRVANVAPVAGGFLVGGAFTTPLTYQEMSTLVL